MKKNVKLSHLLYNPVDEITKETETMARAKEITQQMQDAKLSAGLKQVEETFGSGLISTVKEMQARVESA